MGALGVGAVRRYAVRRTRRSSWPLGRVLTLIAAASALTTPSHAQVAEASPRGRWNIELAGGVLHQPSETQRAGPGVSLVVGRRVGPRVTVSGILLGSRVRDIRAPDPDRYVVNRDWSIAAVGVETPVFSRGRGELVVVGSAGAMWARDRRVGVEGTPIPPGFPEETEDSSWWNAGAIVMPEIGLNYHVTRTLAVTTGVAAIQHVFTDDFFGATGSLWSLGVNLGW